MGISSGDVSSAPETLVLTAIRTRNEKNAIRRWNGVICLSLRKVKCDPKGPGLLAQGNLLPRLPGEYFYSPVAVVVSFPSQLRGSSGFSPLSRSTLQVFCFRFYPKKIPAFEWKGGDRISPPPS